MFWEVVKGIWALLITIITVGIAYGQLDIYSKTVRPSIFINISAGSAAFRAKHGRSAHIYQFQNAGTILAKDTFISVRTRRYGDTLHEDRKVKLGDILVKESGTYVVYLQQKDLKGLDLSARPIVEDFELTYKGTGRWGIFCDPIYTYSALFIYSDEDGRWSHHPESAPSETERCE